MFRVEECEKLNRMQFGCLNVKWVEDYGCYDVFFLFLFVTHGGEILGRTSGMWDSLSSTGSHRVDGMNGWGVGIVLHRLLVMRGIFGFFELSRKR